jgi:hypothetical protein
VAAWLVHREGFKASRLHINQNQANNRVKSKLSFEPVVPYVQLLGLKKGAGDGRWSARQPVVVDSFLTESRKEAFGTFRVGTPETALPGPSPSAPSPRIRHAVFCAGSEVCIPARTG